MSNSLNPTWSNPITKKDIRCYILINNKLPTIHGGIQASHSLAELMVKFPQGIVSDWATNHKTLVFLSATEDEIRLMCSYFEEKSRLQAMFSEPDLDYLLTAAAFEPMEASEGKILFGKFKLFN